MNRWNGVVAVGALSVCCVVAGVIVLVRDARSHVSLESIGPSDRIEAVLHKDNIIRLRLTNHLSSPARLVGTTAC
jgi:hypothetical protein